MVVSIDLWCYVGLLALLLLGVGWLCELLDYVCLFVEMVLWY